MQSWAADPPWDRPQSIHEFMEIGDRTRVIAHRGFSGRAPENTLVALSSAIRIGADMVGMSTVPEVIVARHAGMRILALSAITNVCRPDQLTPTTAEGVVAAAESTEPKMRDIVSGVVQAMGEQGL